LKLIVFGFVRESYSREGPSDRRKGDQSTIRGKNEGVKKKGAARGEPTVGGKVMPADREERGLGFQKKDGPAAGGSNVVKTDGGRATGQGPPGGLTSGERDTARNLFFSGGGRMNEGRLGAGGRPIEKDGSVDDSRENSAMEGGRRASIVK